MISDMEYQVFAVWSFYGLYIFKRILIVSLVEQLRQKMYAENETGTKCFKNFGLLLDYRKTHTYEGLLKLYFVLAGH